MKNRTQNKKLCTILHMAERRARNKLPTITCPLSILKERGSALIITLLLLTILMGLVVEFVYEVYIGTSALSNWSNAQKASLMAKSGQNLIATYIKDIRKASYTYLAEIDIPIENDFAPDSRLVIRLEDENAKFNVNSIIYPNGLTNEKALLSLIKLLEYHEINSSLAMVIADWIDPDSEPRYGNSEHNAKNSYLWSVDELRLINGIDKKIFETISPFITVYGDGKININTAKLPVLVSLSNDMTESLAKKIIQYRESTPFEDKSHIVRVTGLETIGVRILDRITVKSSNFKVIAQATVSEITRVIESVVDTSMRIHHWRET